MAAADPGAVVVDIAVGDREDAALESLDAGAAEGLPGAGRAGAEERSRRRMHRLPRGCAAVVAGAMEVGRPCPQRVVSKTVHSPS
jgi:hypothetical protein